MNKEFHNKLKDIIIIGKLKKYFSFYGCKINESTIKHSVLFFFKFS